MKLNIGSFYPEPSFYFNISHKVFKLIEECIYKDIMMVYGLDEIEKETTISLDITTRRHQTIVEVKGPEMDTENDFLNYGIWLPYYEIVESDKYLEKFIVTFFQAIEHVFLNHGVKKSDITLIKDFVISEVDSSPKYDFQEDLIPPPDLSDLGL